MGKSAVAIASWDPDINAIWPPVEMDSGRLWDVTKALAKEPWDSDTNCTDSSWALFFPSSLEFTLSYSYHEELWHHNLFFLDMAQWNTQTMLDHPCGMFWPHHATPKAFHFGLDLVWNFFNMRIFEDFFSGTFTVVKVVAKVAAMVLEIKLLKSAEE